MKTSNESFLNRLSGFFSSLSPKTSVHIDATKPDPQARNTMAAQGVHNKDEIWRLMDDLDQRDLYKPVDAPAGSMKKNEHHRLPLNPDVNYEKAISTAPIDSEFRQGFSPDQIVAEQSVRSVSSFLTNFQPEQIVTEQGMRSSSAFMTGFTDDQTSPSDMKTSKRSIIKALIPTRKV